MVINHLYVMQAWKKISILLCVEAIGVSTTFDHVLKIIIESIGWVWWGRDGKVDQKGSQHGMWW